MDGIRVSPVQNGVWNRPAAAAARGRRSAGAFHRAARDPQWPRWPGHPGPAPVSSGSGYAARLLAPLPGGYTLGGAGQGAAAGCWRFRRCRPRGRAGSGRVPGRPSRCWPSPVFCWGWPAATCWDRETWLSGQARLQITNSPERITASCEPSWPTPSTSMSALPIIQSTCASDSLPPAARKRSESMSMPPWTLNL